MTRKKEVKNTRGVEAVADYVRAQYRDKLNKIYGRESEPTPDPTPEPTADPIPEPTPDPTPEPSPNPSPEPTPDPEPEM